MAFRERLFPKGVSFGAIGGPGFNTGVITLRSGRERRNANWSEMRHSWEVSQAVKTEEQFKAVRAFFLSVGGQRDGFLFMDWADYKVAITEGVVEGIDGTHFQLQKQYVSFDITTLREINKPVAAKFSLRNSGIPLVLTSDYTLDATTGIVTTMTTRTAANLTWSGEFYVPARFGTDDLKTTIINRNPSNGLLMAWDSVPIVELRL
jgi:uncharacterized protein (TIGR02217 family)